MSLLDDKNRLVENKKKELEAFNEKKRLPDGDYPVKLLKYSFGPGNKSGKDQYVLDWKITEKGDQKGKERKTYHPLHVNDFFNALIDVLVGAGVDLDSYPSMAEKPDVIDTILDAIEDEGQLKAMMKVENKEGKKFPEITIHSITPIITSSSKEEEEDDIEAP
jgi:hypothetical protein